MYSFEYNIVFIILVITGLFFLAAFICMLYYVRSIERLQEELLYV